MENGNNSDVGRIIERLVSLERDKKEICEQISEIKKEAKSAGHLIAAICDNVNRRIMSDDKLRRAKERDEMRRLYAESCGQTSLF